CRIWHCSVRPPRSRSRTTSSRCSRRCRPRRSEETITMTILCQPADVPADLISSIGSGVRSVDDLGAALLALSEDPSENLIVVGPAVETGQALEFSARL